MGGKRASPVAANTTVAKVLKVNPVVKQCGIVSRALKEMGLQSSELKMLNSILSLSLATPKHERHPYQGAVVEEVERLLHGYEQTLEQSVESVTAQLSTADSDNATLAGAVQAASDELDIEGKAYTEKRHALANVASRYHEANNCYEEACVAQTCGDDECAVLLKTIDNLDSGVADSLEPLKQGTLAEGLVAHNVATALLLNRWKNVEMDKALRQVSVTALSKAPSDRGAFENTAISSLDQALEKILSSTKAKASEVDATKRRLAAGVSEAKRLFDEAMQAQVVAAKLFLAVQAKKEQLEQAKTRAEDSVRDLAKERKKIEKNLGAAKAKLQSFRMGAWATFVELRECSLPAEVEERLPAAVVSRPQEEEPTLVHPGEGVSEEVPLDDVVVSVEVEACSEDAANVKDVPTGPLVFNTASAGA